VLVSSIEIMMCSMGHVCALGSLATAVDEAMAETMVEAIMV
jgi:hypothetical protein